MSQAQVTIAKITISNPAGTGAELQMRHRTMFATWMLISTAAPMGSRDKKRKTKNQLVS